MKLETASQTERFVKMQRDHLSANVAWWRDRLTEIGESGDMAALEQLRDDIDAYLNTQDVPHRYAERSLLWRLLHCHNAIRALHVDASRHRDYANLISDVSDHLGYHR